MPIHNCTVKTRSVSILITSEFQRCGIRFTTDYWETFQDVDAVFEHSRDGCSYWSVNLEHVPQRIFYAIWAADSAGGMQWQNNCEMNFIIDEFVPKLEKEELRDLLHKNPLTAKYGFWEFWMTNRPEISLRSAIDLFLEFYYK